MPHELTGVEEKNTHLVKVLRAAIAFSKEAGSEQLKQIPVVGPLLAGASAALLEYTDEPDQERLEKKLAKLLSIGTQSQKDVDVLKVLTQVIVVQNAELHALLLGHFTSAGLSTEPKEFDAVAAETALAAYRSSVELETRYADYRGIEGMTRIEHAASLPLDDVYVLPVLKRERGGEKIRAEEKEALSNVLDIELPSEERAAWVHKYSEYVQGRWRTGDGTETDAGNKHPIGEVLGQSRHLVILGGPGVGKSTFLRYMARVCALGSEKMQERLAWSEDLTPVVVPLARFADALTRNGSLGLRDFILDQVEERGGRTLRGAIAHRLDRGRVLLMLDGVDEPLTESRASVVKAIDRFRVDNCDNRVLVTSRPFGYARLGGDLAHYELPNFSRRQVRAFVEHWHTAFEHWQHPTAANDDRAQAEAKEMLREINRDERIAELAANPLMLVIISLIRREGGRLPEKRVELYNRAVNTLMDTWNRWRTEGAANVGGSHLPIDRLVSVWGRIAEWTRRTKSTGVIHRAELKTKLVEVLIEKELDDEDPENTAESYLNAAANKAGLLEERGKDIFAFWHPTFEEFLAAVELATPTARAVARITPLRYDPRWREVVLLAIGYVGTIQRDAETATAIVEAIVDSEPEPIEFLTHPALRLAVACVQDDIGVRRSFADRLIRELAGFIRITPYYPLMQVLHDVVEANPLFRPSPSTVKALLPVATDENWWARRDVARLCSNISGTNPSAKQFCRNLLSDWDADIMAAGALGLLRGGDYDPDLWLSLFGHTGFEIPETVEPGLSDFGKSIPDDALESLRTLLAASEFGHYQRAAEILSIVGRSSRKVIDALQSWLAAKQPRLQLQSASVLVKLGYASDSVSHTLRSLLDVDDPSVRLDAAFLLLDLEEAEDQVAQCALSLLETDDPDQLDGAFYILDETGHVDDGVLEALLSRLESKKLAVRKVAARPLLESGYRDQQLLDVLRSWLDDPDLNGRAFAANSLVQKGHVDEAVIQTLHVLVACEEYGLPMNAAEKLVNLGRADEKELDMLVSSFADRRSAYPDNSGQQLMQQLIDLVHLDRLMESLRRMIATGSERDRAVKLLIRLCNSHPTFQTFQQELRARLEQENPNTRIGILEALSELRPDEDAVEVLRELLAEEDYKVKLRAAELLAKLGLAPRDVQEAYRSLLSAKDISIRLSAAEHLVTLESAQGGEVVEALCSVLTADRHSWYSERAFNTLFSLGDKGLSTLVAEIQGDSSEALRACQRIARGEEFTTKDARAIVKLLRADGKPKTPWGFKQSLFKWVWDHVEQRVGAVAVQ